jgi:hypothetical protein
MNAPVAPVSVAPSRSAAFRLKPPLGGLVVRLCQVMVRFALYDRPTFRDSEALGFKVPSCDTVELSTW